MQPHSAKRDMSGVTTVSLVRHGDVHNPADIYYGRLPDFHLSELGREQARRAGQVLRERPVTAVYCSPMLRARQTAALIQEELSAAVPVQTAEELLEVHTPHDGISRTELAARYWDLYTGSEPSYEQPADVVQRLQRFLAMVGQHHAGEHVVAVTHGDVVAFTLLWAAGYPAAVDSRQHIPELIGDVYPETASITTLVFEEPLGMPRALPAYSYHNPHMGG